MSANRLFRKLKKYTRKAYKKIKTRINCCDNFLKNTTIHGLYYAKISDHVAIRWAWVLIVLMGWIGAICLSAQLWYRYSEQPSRLTLRSPQKSVSYFDFPGITICDTSPRQFRIKKFLSRLNYTSGIKPKHIKNSLNILVKKFNSLDTAATIEKELLMLESILTINKLSIREALRNIATPCNETILFCQWEGIRIPCSQLFTFVLTGSGFCCSFNTRENKNIFKPHKMRYFGPHMGLSLILRHNENTDGRIRVFVHRSRETPWSNRAGAVFYSKPTVGHVSYISVNVLAANHSEALRTLPITSRKCVDPNEIKLQYFQDYRRNYCMVECGLNASLALCDCAPYNTPIEESKICTVSDINCLYSHFDIIFSARLIRDDPDLDDDLSFIHDDDEKDQVKMCPCWNLCQFIWYKSHSQHMNMDTTQFDITGFYDLIQNKSQESAVHIYVDKQFLKEWNQILVADWLSLLGSLGGVFSLCLGCSFITLVEFFFYFIVKICNKYKKIMKTHRVRMANILDDKSILRKGDVTNNDQSKNKGVILGPNFFSPQRVQEPQPKRKLSYVHEKSIHKENMF